MIKSIFNKWDELKNQCVNDNLEIVTPYHLGNDCITKLYLSFSHNCIGLYLEFSREALTNFKIQRINGMSISIKEAPFINKEKQYIYIQNDSNNEDIFVAFSSSLSDALSNTKSYFEAFNKLNDTLKEYKDYFANQTPSLSKIEEQGLYCELYELSNLIDKFGEKIILNWLGPSKNKRDFVFNKCAIEVKSTSTQLNCLLKISNENQLDNQYPKELCGLFLSVYIIEEENEGYDVASLANEIYQKIESVQLRHTFSLLLLKMKVDIEQYKPNFKFKIQKKTYYRVDDSFPKITKSNVDSNICNVSYSIKIDNLSKFIIDEEKVYEQL